VRSDPGAVVGRTTTASQITIIAANFQAEDSVVREEKRHVRRERVPRDANLDVPTFLRRERDGEDTE
jgi:hypothetical protein